MEFAVNLTYVLQILTLKTCKIRRMHWMGRVRAMKTCKRLNWTEWRPRLAREHSEQWLEVSVTDRRMRVKVRISQRTTFMLPKTRLSRKKMRQMRQKLLKIQQTQIIWLIRSTINRRVKGEKYISRRRPGTFWTIALIWKASGRATTQNKELIV